MRANSSSGSHKVPFSGAEVPPDTRRPRIGLAMAAATFAEYVRGACTSPGWNWSDVVHETFDRPSSFETPPPPHRVDDERLRAMVRELDAIVICHGAPRISAESLANAPRLTFIGELEGDRFARRVDVRAAAARGIRVVDTTHASSLAVAEWAVALAIIGLRDGGRWFRQAIADDPADARGILEAGAEAFGRELIGARGARWARPSDVGSSIFSGPSGSLSWHMTPSRRANLAMPMT